LPPPPLFSSLTAPRSPHLAPLSLLDALPISMLLPVSAPFHSRLLKPAAERLEQALSQIDLRPPQCPVINNVDVARPQDSHAIKEDRKSTCLNSSHVSISYAVFCLK